MLVVIAPGIALLMNLLLMNLLLMNLLIYCRSGLYSYQADIFIKSPSGYSNSDSGYLLPYCLEILLLFAPTYDRVTGGSPLKLWQEHQSPSHQNIGPATLDLQH
ncbi:hypothetical protein BST81_23255 [Leptolyngbya sp. 'hensonii']|nr:hypothetical protein BST81_23255 [Leptolyngbya sp. 'hensonii']